MRHAFHRGPWPLAVDISQSLEWGSCSARACPRLTTSSKIAIVYYANASFHMLTDKQAVNFIGLGGLSIPRECSSSMTDLLGNGIHVDCIGLAVGLAVSLVSAQPIPKERKVYVRLVLEMAADHGSLHGHSACRRPSKERPQARGTLPRRYPRIRRDRTEKEGSQGQVAQEAPRIFAPQAPSASVGGLWERMYS